MEANSILKADMLDILFENRNKEYGAYELRKTYNKRIKHAVAIMCMLCLMLLVVNIFAGSKKSSAVPLMVSDTIKLTKIDEQHPEEIKAPLLKPPVQNVATIKDAIPRIMPDKEVRPEDIPPTTDQLEDNVQIGSVTKGGDIGDVVAPPVEQSTGSGEGPKETKEDYDKIFTVVQVEAEFPGGLNAWAKYLESNLRTEVPLENGASAGKYTVTVSFLVDKEGNVSEIQALNDPGFGTAEEAIRVIKKSKQWKPAIQNGRNVNYRQQQSITFIVEEGQ